MGVVRMPRHTFRVGDVVFLPSPFHKGFVATVTEVGRTFVKGDFIYIDSGIVLQENGHCSVSSLELLYRKEVSVENLWE